MDNEGFVNGGVIASPDSRDLLLGSVQAPEDIDAVEDLSDLPIYLQSGQPACGAHAVAWFGTYQEWKETGRVRAKTPRYNWARIKSRDGFPLDAGTDLRNVMKSKQKDGVLDFDLMGNDVSLPLEAYSNPAITPEMYANAQPTIGGVYAFVENMTFERLRQAVQQNGVVIALADYFEGWKGPDGAISADGRFYGRHFICLHRPQPGDDRERIHFANSFGRAWGRDGHGSFGPEFMPHILAAAAEPDLPDGAVEAIIETLAKAKEQTAALVEAVGKIAKEQRK